ncbi:MAG: hypothetical protein M0Z48_01580 [Nitrospiraceae bacterium]|nr:hypothetical protein [Nitrospiraceae bacterium]
MFSGEFIEKVRYLNKTLKPKMTLKELAKSLGIGSWHTLRKYLETGSIPQKVLDRAEIVLPDLIEERQPKPEPSAPKALGPITARLRELGEKKKAETGFHLEHGRRIAFRLRSVEKADSQGEASGPRTLKPRFGKRGQEPHED